MGNNSASSRCSATHKHIHTAGTQKRTSRLSVESLFCGGAVALHPSSIPLLAQSSHFLLQMLYLTGLLFQLFLTTVRKWLLQAAVYVICLCARPATFERQGLPSEHFSPQTGQLCLHPPVQQFGSQKTDRMQLDVEIDSAVCWGSRCDLQDIQAIYADV